MDEIFRVDVFDSGYELICEEKDGFQAEATGAEVEQVFQGRT